MSKHAAPLFLFVAAVALAAPNALAVERSAVPEQLKWNTADLYASDDAWRKDRDDLARRIPDLGKFKGHLGDSAGALFTAAETILDAVRLLQRVSVYASMRSDEDTRDQNRLGMNQEAQQISVQFGSAIAYLRPELLALGSDRVKGFVAQDARLKPYTVYLDDIVRWAPHTLSAAEETLVAKTGDMAGAGYAIQNVFANAEFPFPEVVLPGGEKVRLDAQAYTKYRASAKREERVVTFRSFFGALAAYAGTFGATLDAGVRAHVFDKDVHKFQSCLEAATFPVNVPTKVYAQLIKDVRANLPVLHRYLRLRQRMMGLVVLTYEDLYAPIVKSVDLRYTPEQAQELVLKSVAPLGPDYVAALRKGFADRWIDWMPNTGKKSGAYSTGVYGIHPYQLQNFTGLYDEVSTLAHESGHSMHTYLANTTQPFVNAGYPIFVAEVASTLNEALLLDSMLKDTKDRDTRLFLLGSRLEGLRTTLFRQAMFAEFELRIHEMAERGEPLTGEKLTALYRDMVKEYYGDAQGVCKVDDLYGIEWAYITHFFYNFYVYQYATSMVASSSLAHGILSEARASKPSTRARDAYLAMLSAGSSKYAIDLLKDAGVDMTTSAPFNAAMAEMNGIMDEMEGLLKK
jgi:oligoendopeptidase F